MQSQQPSPVSNLKYRHTCSSSASILLLSPTCRTPLPSHNESLPLLNSKVTVPLTFGLRPALTTSDPLLAWTPPNIKTPPLSYGPPSFNLRSSVQVFRHFLHKPIHTTL